MKKAMTACLALVVLAGLASARGPAPAFTRVTLTELHCMGCAKKISKQVTAVAGVAEMRVDLKAKTIWAIHKPGMTPSPKALWEAIERGDHKPTLMEGPQGKFTSKPQS